MKKGTCMPTSEVHQVTDDLTLIRINDTRVKYFESQWHIPEGITYNSYVLRTSEGAAVFELSKERFSEEYLEALKEVISPAEVKYLIVDHAEPDHTGAMRPFLQLCPDAKVVGIGVAEGIVKAKYGQDIAFVPVKDGSELRLGGRTIRFVYSPWVHWPETMMSLIPEEGVVISGDAFGGYSIPSGWSDDDVQEEYIRYSKKYLATVIGSYREHLVKAISKLRASMPDPSVVAPAHGLVWVKQPKVIVDLYESWGKATPDGSVVVAWVSMYGSIKETMEKLIALLQGHGIAVKKYSFSDEERGEREDLLADALTASVIVLGTPTYETEAHPLVKELFASMGSKLKGTSKPAFVLVSYAWGSVAEKQLWQSLSNLGFDVRASVSFKERISNEDLSKLAEQIAAAAKAV